MINNQIIYNIYPFNKNKGCIILIRSIEKIQRWYKYYHIPHFYFHNTNSDTLVSTRFNITKLIILYLTYPNYYYFKENPVFYTKSCNTEFIYLFNLSNKFKMYCFLKNMKYNNLKNLYLYIKNIN